MIKGSTVYKANINVGTMFSDIYQVLMNFMLDSCRKYTGYMLLSSYPFLQCEGGLTQHEADQRHEIIGKNEIPFKPESLLHSAYVELFSLFHVYQLVMYLLWFWNSYLFVAALLTIIVCLSAAITIYTRHQSQMTIAKVYLPSVFLIAHHFVPFLVYNSCMCMAVN